MSVNQSFNLFPLLPEAAINETTRPGQMTLEYFQASVTITSLEGTVEIPTQLGAVLGLLDFKYNSAGAGDPTDTIQLHTDGVITTGAVTVNVTFLDIGNGAITIRGFLIGTTRSATVLINDPDEA